MKKPLVSLIAATVLGLAVGCAQPTIEEVKDLTGDGIKDIVVNIKNGLQQGTWLYIGQEDGTYIRATKHTDTENSKVEYFITDDGQVYFFDGKIYRQSPNKE